MKLRLPDVPDGWTWTTVADVGSTSDQAVLTGPFGTSLGPNDFIVNTGAAVPVLTIGSLREAGIDLGKATFVSPEKATELQRYRLRAGDILFSRMATVGRAGFVRKTHEGSLFNYHLMRLRLRDDVVDPEFFIYYVRGSDVVRAYVRSVNHGMTRDGINTEQLLSLPLPLAPRDQQQRIVEAIEDLLSRVDAASTSLARAQVKLKAYRASVLKAVVEGRLVPTEAELARREGRSYEAADVLLERILTERRRRWEEAELAKMKAAGRRPQDDRWKTKYDEPTRPDTRKLPNLPDGWCWATVDQLSRAVFYGSSSKAEISTNEAPLGVPVLRMGNIAAGALDLSLLKYLPVDHEEFPDLLLEPGDLLFNRTNSPELVGKTAVYKGDPSPCSFASYLICVRVLPDVDPQWVAHVINSPFGRQWVGSVVTQQVGQANVNGSKLKALAVPLPPTEEQRRCVSKTDELFSNTDVQQDVIRRQLLRLNRLRQAILKWAFEGRLVDQTAGDEPADVLLARVRSELAAEPVEPKHGRPRKLKVAS